MQTSHQGESLWRRRGGGWVLDSSRACHATAAAVFGVLVLQPACWDERGAESEWRAFQVLWPAADSRTSRCDRQTRGGQGDSPPPPRARVPRGALWYQSVTQTAMPVSAGSARRGPRPPISVQAVSAAPPAAASTTADCSAQRSPCPLGAVPRTFWTQSGFRPPTSRASMTPRSSNACRALTPGLSFPPLSGPLTPCSSSFSIHTLCLFLARRPPNLKFDGRQANLLPPS